MPNGVKYVIMLIVLVGLAKILQVIVFDSEQPKKNKKEESAIKSYEKSKAYSGTPGNLNKKKKADKVGSIRKKKVEDTNKRGRKFKDTPNITLESLKNNYLSSLLAQLPENQLRKDIVVRYYRHKKDLNKVYKLIEMSYYIHEKEATETAGLGSNIIYYGDDVPPEDIQIVAFTLLEEGIPLKSIKHTKFDWKAKAIEIGTDTTLINEPNISIQEIQDFQK
ncbi:MAG: hypothetical protein GDA42_11670 [Ekhidna sp.]|nr:hypothetical protein [Ekhidna sp.]MBC6411089.1 hypothetical protein [Ekhidna sp.]